MNNIKPVYPLDFDEDMKTKYDLYIRQAKVLYPESEEWSIKFACEAFIRQGDKERPTYSEDEVNDYRDRYDTTTEYTTVINPDELIINPDPCNWIES